MNIAIKRENILFLMQLLPNAKGTGKVLNCLNSVAKKLRDFIPLNDQELNTKRIAEIAAILLDNYKLELSGVEFDAVESFCKDKYAEVITLPEFNALISIASNLNITLDAENNDET